MVLLYNIPPLDANAFCDGHLADLSDLYLPDAGRTGVVSWGVFFEGEQLGGGAVVLIAVEVHALEPDPLQKPFGVRRGLQLVPLVFEGLKVSGGYLVHLAVELRLEFGGHPADLLPASVDPLIQHHEQRGLDLSNQRERGRLVPHLEDLRRGRGALSVTMAGSRAAVGSSWRVVVLLGPRGTTAPGSPTGP